MRKKLLLILVPGLSDMTNIDWNIWRETCFLEAGVIGYLDLKLDFSTS